jgi:hypothetical protein
MKDREYERFKAQLLLALERPEVQEIFREAFREAVAGVILNLSTEQRTKLREYLRRGA